jgi:hypothetical protein
VYAAKQGIASAKPIAEDLAKRFPGTQYKMWAAKNGPPALLLQWVQQGLAVGIQQ